ncbi:hypothetical protein A2V68_01630 [candidate division Kazan bacterium RBG_13_50_9]|uniref:Glycosyltransferase RgtA/B/C/D-like domain-containing protein n=1 Tax=candidate division Kazan bacterium RBG_13_50_9 TaxID=1798535 RepID=A0A1F4NSX6_UNCK3|nr:MAG: hypothetical protein A2V68_01630 [candidate division Kazan bacterium RBG_13_50_9]
MRHLSRAVRKPNFKDFYYSFQARSERYWLGVLAIAVILSRYLGHMRYLYAADSVRYGLALDHYDISLHQPHPPGYAFYILTAKPLYWLTGDTNLALIIVGIVFSALAVYAVFYLAKRIYGVRVAWISVLILATAPTVWFYGQVALNYITDVFFAALFGIYAYDSLKNPKDATALLKASMALAVGGGFRPTLVIFMLPLWLWLVLRRKDIRAFLWNGLIIGLITLAWLVPAAILSGGLTNFWHTVYSLIFDKSAIYTQSVFNLGTTRMWTYLKDIGSELTLAFGLAIVPAVLWLVSLAAPRSDVVKVNYKHLLFWVLWLLPALLFYSLIVFTVYGYLLILMPALVILVAAAMEEVAKAVALGLSAVRAQRRTMAGQLIIVAVMLIAGLNIFNYYQPQPSPQPQRSSYHTVASLSHLWDVALPVIKKEFNPQSTIIGLNNSFLSWSLQHFQYYLPQYVAYQRIEWGIYNPENRNWFMAYGGESQLVDSLDVGLTDANMIIVRDRWYGQVDGNFQKISLAPYGLNAEIIYYDLTDPKIRQLVKKIDDVKFLGDEDTETSKSD